MFIRWNEAFELGVPRVDAEHRHLVGVVNAFYEVYRTRAGREKIFPVLNLLVKYTEVHFRSEEALMEAGDCPDLPDHQREHDKLTEQIFTLAEKYEAGDAEISDEVMEFLKRWLLEHILQVDKKLQPFFQEHGIPDGWEQPNVPPPREAISSDAASPSG